MVNGWVGETLSFLVSPLNAIADAVQWVANGIGSELQNMSRDFAEWYDGITSNFTSLGDSIGGFFSTITDAIGSWFGDVGRWFAGLGDSLARFFGSLTDVVIDVFDSFVTLLDYLNPLSENNFLKILFIPKDGFFTTYFSDLKSALDNKFPIANQIRDTWDSIKTAVSDRVNGWDGFKVDMSRYGAGTLTIVDPTFVNYVAPKLRFWIGAALYFMTFLFLIKRSSQLIGAGR